MFEASWLQGLGSDVGRVTKSHIWVLINPVKSSTVLLLKARGLCFKSE